MMTQVLQKVYVKRLVSLELDKLGLLFVGIDPIINLLILFEPWLLHL